MNPEDYIKFDPSEFEGWTAEEVPSEIQGWCRFYWKRNKTYWNSHQTGFKFESFEIGMMTGDGKPFADGKSCVEKLIHGSAAFDGVRHLYFGASPQNEGYFFYPDWRAIMWILLRVQELEAEFCSQVDRVQPILMRPELRGIMNEKQT